MSDHYDDSSYQERMESQHGHPGDVALAEDIIPKEKVAAALRDIEESIERHLRYCKPPGCGEGCLGMTREHIRIKRRELGIEEVK